MTANTIRPGDKPQPAQDDLPVVAWLGEDNVVYGAQVAAIPAEIASDLLADPVPNWQPCVLKSDALAYAAKERERALEEALQICTNLDCSNAAAEIRALLPTDQKGEG